MRRSRSRADRSPPDGAGFPKIRLGPADVRVTLASRDRIRFTVPAGRRAPGASRFASTWLPARPRSSTWPRSLATGVHCVDSPAIASDGTVYVTCSGSRGQQTPVSVYRIVLGGVREIFATGVTNATSLAFDPLGRLHVTSRFDGTVSQARPERPPGGRRRRSRRGDGAGVRARWHPLRRRSHRDGLPDLARRRRRRARHPASRASRRSTWRSPRTDATLYATGPTLAPRDPVYRIAPDGAVEVVTARFGRPQGLAFGPGDRLYVVEALAGAAGVYEVSRRRGVRTRRGGVVRRARLREPRRAGPRRPNDTVYRLPSLRPLTARPAPAPATIRVVQIRGSGSRPDALLYQMSYDSIAVRGARVHNLKNIDVDLPREPAGRRHRPVGLGEVVARLRHDLRRGPAPLRGVAVGLRAAVPRADGEAGRRPDRRPVAGDLDRAEDHRGQPAVDRRHRHRDLRLPAPALRQRRRAALPAVRPRDRRAVGRADRRPRDVLPDRRAHQRARAGRPRQEGRVQEGTRGAGARRASPARASTASSGRSRTRSRSIAGAITPSRSWSIASS